MGRSDKEEQDGEEVRGVRSRLFLEELESLESLSGFLEGQLVVLSVRSPLKESANEDGALVAALDGRRAVLAVADGVGGQPAGKQASRMALVAVQQSLEALEGTQAALREAILRGLDDANGRVIDEDRGSATTMAMAEIDDGRLRTYHVGDSAVIVFDEAGRLLSHTIAHSPVGYALEAGVLDEGEAFEHEDRHLVSNVIGDPGMHVGVSYPIELTGTDTVVVASDGLFDNLRLREVVDLLREGPLEEAVKRLAAECRRRMLSESEEQPGKPDDLTLIAFRPS